MINIPWAQTTQLHRLGPCFGVWQLAARGFAVGMLAGSGGLIILVVLIIVLVVLIVLIVLWPLWWWWSCC
jgi:lipoprotein signal peptidase